MRIGRRFSRLRIRMAVGADQMTALVPSTSTHVTVPCVVTADLDSTEALRAALEEMRLQISAATGSSLSHVDVDIALLPPLTETRLIALPPLRNAEAEIVIRRDAARHFVGASGPRAFALKQPARARAGTAPVLAVAATATLIEQLHRAVGGIGWRVHAVSPAIASWLSVVERTSTHKPYVIIAQVGDTLHVVRGKGDPLQIRRVPRTSLGELWESIGAGPGLAYLFTTDADRTAIERGLVAAGWQVEPPTSIPGDAATVAAHLVAPGGWELVPQSLHLERQQNQRRLATRLAAVTFLLLVAAMATELWGARRELSQLRAQRAAIREQVSPLLATRDSVQVLDQRSARVTGLVSQAPSWTSALFDLAMLLPADTHLRSLRAQGDTLVVEASGNRAGETIQALRSANTLRDVRLKGQVERELQDGATSMERFTLQARLAPRDSLARPDVAGPDTRARAGRSQ
ncbi:MAG: PilN domain-containing protein [Longimicrobiales bacterium]